MSVPDEIEDSASFEPGMSDRIQQEGRSKAKRKGRSGKSPRQAVPHSRDATALGPSDILDAGDIQMQFLGSDGEKKQDVSGQIRKINDLDETPFGDEVSNDTNHGNAAIDLSGESIQVDSGREKSTGHPGGPDLFDDLNHLASAGKQKMSALKTEAGALTTVQDTNWTEMNRHSHQPPYGSNPSPKDPVGPPSHPPRQIPSSNSHSASARSHDPFKNVYKDNSPVSTETL